MSETNWNARRGKTARAHDASRVKTAGVQRPRRPSRTEFRLARIQEISAKYEFYERLSVIGVWARLTLLAALTLSLFWWPYGRDCGFGLGAFLASNAIAIVAGLTLTARTWRDRTPWQFTGALLFVGVAWTVIALNTLPRLDSGASRAVLTGWSCPANR